MSTSSSHNRITIYKWDNLGNQYLPFMILKDSQVNGQAPSVSTPVSVVFSKSAEETYNLMGLRAIDIPHNSNIPAALGEVLPGAFANKLLQSVDASWNKNSDFMKLVRLGSRDLGTYRFVVNSADLDKSLIIGQEKLDEVMGKLHIALNKNELNDLLDKSNFYSLTSTKGAKPKIEYQDADGDRWIVKAHSRDTAEISNAYAKMELASLMMLDDLNVETPHTDTHVCPDGRVVFMSKHYNMAQPTVDIFTGYAEHKNRYNTLNVKTLSTIASLQQTGHKSHVFDYNDVVNSIESTVNSFTEGDRIQLLKRAVFDVAVNNTETGAHKIEFIEDDFGEYKLAPCTGAIPDVAKNPFSLTIGEKYSSQLNVNLDDNFCQCLSETFGLPVSEVKIHVAAIADVVLRREDYMRFAGMNDNEISVFKGAFLADEKLQTAAANHIDNDPVQSFKNTFLASSNEPKQKLTL